MPSSPPPAPPIRLAFFRNSEAVLWMDACAGQRLIDVVREQNRLGRLDLPWRCAQGTCGTCVVSLAQTPAHAAGVALTRMERNVLARRGLLPADAPLQQPDDTATPRLACHVVLERDAIVYFQNS